MINPSMLHPTPSFRRVVEAQLRFVWNTIRGMVAVLSVFVVLTAFYMYVYSEGGFPFLFEDYASFIAIIASFFPIAMWRGEYRFRQSYLASMPVDRTRHTLLKIAAGWAWLMVLVAASVLCMLALAAATGGPIGTDEMRVFARDLPPSASAEEAAALARRWTTPIWQWALFFPGATVAYLFGSIVVLASRRTRLWLGGLFAGSFFLLMLEEEGVNLGEVLEGAFRFIITIIIGGRYGLETLVIGSDDIINTLTTATGDQIRVWSEPDLGTWLVSMLLWMSLAMVSVVVAVWRDRKA
jgi:hypothetical protein